MMERTQLSSDSSWMDQYSDNLSSLLQTIKNVMIEYHVLSIKKNARKEHPVYELQAASMNIIPSNIGLDVSIYHVPETVRKSNEDAYEPQLVSLGPFHSGKEHLSAMESHKKRSLDQMLQRSGNHDVRPYIEAILSVEGSARYSYENSSEESQKMSDEFVYCMLVDGCFILEMIQGVVGRGFTSLGYVDDDPVFSLGGSIALHVIQRDMLLLENQIPFCILHRILTLQLGLPKGKGSTLLVQMILRFFNPLIIPTDEMFPESKQPFTETELQFPKNTTSYDSPFLHCLHVFWRGLVGLPDHGHLITNRQSFKTAKLSTPSVVVLRNSGIKFKRRRENRIDDTYRLWDVKYEKDILYIPHLNIHDGSKSLFFNLMALEHCAPHMSNHITSYVVFMGSIINSGEDVNHLQSEEIIEHSLGSDQKVADVFNNLCKEVVLHFDGGYLSTIIERVNEYYHKKNNISLQKMMKLFFWK